MNLCGVRVHGKLGVLTTLCVAALIKPHVARSGV